MIRVLPITILFLFIFVGFTAFKSYNKENEKVEQTSDKETDAIVAQLDKDLNQLETAAGEVPPVEVVPDSKMPDAKKAEANKAAITAKEEKSAVDENGKKELPGYVKKERPAENIPDLTKSGQQLLEQMAARRTELDEWKKDLDLRASLIEASSHKLDEKIAKLETLKAVTQKLLDEYKVEDNNKIKSMVKVYENMKPKDAATVFDKLDMPILLEIVEQMNERKLSAILAKMDSSNAKKLTEKIIENRDLAKM